jgi:hypothetical protein
MTDEDLAKCLLKLLHNKKKEHETPYIKNEERKEDGDTLLTIIEVMPGGLELPLQGSQETRQAVQDDFLTSTFLAVNKLPLAFERLSDHVDQMKRSLVFPMRMCHSISQVNPTGSLITSSMVRKPLY